MKEVVPKQFFRNQSQNLAGALLLLLAASQAGAIKDTSLQMQLGNPSGASADTNNHDHYLIQRPVEAIDYSDHLGQPNWASWDLTSEDANGAVGRSSTYFTDTSLPPGFYQVTSSDYTGSGWTRGHMCPSADRTDSRADNDMVFLMSNMIPQAGSQNSGVWAQLEEYCRALASAGNELLITCGPSRFTGDYIASGHVAVPGYTWKIAVVVPLGAGTALERVNYSTRIIAVNITNSDTVGAMAWTNFLTSVNKLQTETGFTFFTALPPNLATVLRSKVDGQTSPAPTIADFSPGSGAVGTGVTITGTNLNFTTNVTFNGTSAAFSIDSVSQLTATVPAGATSGHISVAALSATATSSGSFIVDGSAPPDLAILAGHTGNFTQGDSGYTYTILVTNTGTGASSGTVTVVDTLPAGLAATAISGDGWSADLPTLTCTRSDALAANAGYPPITITVDVATNAPLSVTNSATVSGGGETNLTNNTAEDPTTILPANVGVVITTLAGWDVSQLPGGAEDYGPSPLPPTTNAAEVTVIGLTRGSGVGTSGTAAARAWGGNNWTNDSALAAVTNNHFFTFGLQANTGYKVSYASISTFDYRHSGTGPVNGLLQYQLGTEDFADIAVLSYPSAVSGGASLSPIDLSGIPQLQNVGAGTNVTFRVVNWGGTSPGGTWYVFDVAGSPDPDLAVEGTVTPAEALLSPIEAWRVQWFGTTNNSGAAADTAIGTSDGMPNLLKYALGLNPLVPTNSPVVGDISTGYLRLTLPRNPQATDVSFHVEVTGDLNMPSWTTNRTTVIQDTPTLLQVREDTPVASSPGAFARLRVSRP